MTQLLLFLILLVLLGAFISWWIPGVLLVLGIVGLISIWNE